MTNPNTDQPTKAFWERPRNGNGRFTRTIESVRRDAAAAEYQADHPEATLAQIAQHFGYYDKSEARRAILRAKADVARPAITKLIATESEELDALYAEALAILQRHHVTVSHGKVITWRNPDTGEEEPLRDDGPRLAALRIALSIRDQYQNLHGLKQPAKVDATIHQVDQSDIELAELIREENAKNAVTEQRIKGTSA